MKIYSTIVFAWITFLQNTSNLCQITVIGPTTINGTSNFVNLSIIGNCDLEGNVNKNTSLSDNNSLVIGNTQSINPTQIVINNLPTSNDDTSYGYVMLDQNNSLYISPVLQLINKKNGTASLNSLYTNIIEPYQNDAVLVNTTNQSNTTIGTDQNAILNLIGNRIILNGILKSSNNLLSFVNTTTNINSVSNIGTLSIDNDYTENNISSDTITFNKEITFDNNTTKIINTESNFYSKFIMDGTLITITSDELIFNQIYIKGLPIIDNELQNINFLSLDTNNLDLKIINNAEYNSTVNVKNVNNLDDILNVNIKKSFSLSSEKGAIVINYNSKNTYIDNLQITITLNNFNIFDNNNNNILAFKSHVFINELDISNTNNVTIKNLNLQNSQGNTFSQPFSLTDSSFNINNNTTLSSSGKRLVLDANFNVGLEPGSSENFKENITDLAISKEQFIENIQPKYLEIKDKENKKKEIFLTICPQKLQDPILKLICDYDENGNVIGYEERGLLTILLTQILNINEELNIFNKNSEQILEKKEKFEKSKKEFELSMQNQQEKIINLLF